MSKSTSKPTGVKCDAENCVHHSGDCTCNADCIKVGCPGACSCQETNCATFQLKDDMH